MIGNEGTMIAQTAGLVAAGLIALVFGIQRLLKGWKETSTESNIISLMHEELSRLSVHNKTLAEELAKFQIEVLRLNKQLHDLTLENQRLHNEVVSLTTEIARLQGVIAEIKRGDDLAKETQKLSIPQPPSD